MPIETGQNLLHYRLIAQIGEGGMGVVWRARDTTLDRDVAIKLLPQAVSSDSERLLRFEREARLLASLNHPNIATIHGFHSAEGVHFLAMELVEGEDLEQRIAREPIELARAVEIATQVARALEAAHGQGVVHRDLKPANVKLTASGDAKVLDFGLAKALAAETVAGESAASPSLSPTLTSTGTVAGMILGTAAYMAPEQARGKPVDKRADLWAFGCLLFEMLAGQRCFAGETVSDTLVAVLKEEPQWSQLPGETPRAIRRLLRRCLAKDPRYRLSDAADACLELGEAFDEENDGAVMATAPASLPAPARSKMPWILAALAMAIVAALGWKSMGGRPQPEAAREPIALSISIPSSIALSGAQEQVLALSPDGRHLVFVGIGEDSSAPALYLRELRTANIVRLPGTEGGENPFFSPDGRWIGFFANGWLKKIRIGTETAIELCESAGRTRGASWGADDRIVFSPNFSGGLLQVSASGGEPAMLSELDPDRKERTHRWPYVVPGHDVVLFTVATTDSPEFYGDARIEALRLSTGERKTVFEGASRALYAPTGHLLLASSGFLHAVPFDIDTLETEGAPQPVVEGVAGAEDSGAVYAGIAANGLLAYVPGRSAKRNTGLTWFHADGTNLALAGADLGSYVDPSVSPDGQRIAVAATGDRARDIWVYDLELGSRLRLTFAGDNKWPIWMPDGKSVMFYSVRDGVGSTYATAADGSGQERLVIASEDGTQEAVTDVSPDGRLALQEVAEVTNDIYVKSLVDLDSAPVLFLESTADLRHPRFSPDGRWIAYFSDETGSYEVFVRQFPGQGQGQGGHWQVSKGGGTDPIWSRDGRRIHYRRNREWWTVDVDPGDGDGRPFRSETPRLVRADLPLAALDYTYALSAAGDALLMQPEISSAVDEIRVVVNWLDELQRVVSNRE